MNAENRLKAFLTLLLFFCVWCHNTQTQKNGLMCAVGGWGSPVLFKYFNRAIGHHHFWRESFIYRLSSILYLCDSFVHYSILKSQHKLTVMTLLSRTHLKGHNNWFWHSCVCAACFVLSAVTKGRWWANSPYMTQDAVPDAVFICTNQG